MSAASGLAWLGRLAIAICLLTVPCGVSARAQWFGETSDAVASAEDEDNPYAPGLIARFRDAEGGEATRLIDGLSHVWNSSPPDERLRPGPFSVTFSGRLWVQAPGTYRLRAFAAGDVSLSVNGQQILKGNSAEPGWLAAEPIELPFGFHPLEVEYHGDGQHSRIGVYWEGPNFGFEPLASRWLLHEREQAPSQDFERGRLLVRGLRCGACHELPGGTTPLVAPALVSLEGNLSRAWLVDWLTAPGADRDSQPARRMPHFAYSPDQAAAMADALLGASEPPPPQVDQFKPAAEQPAKKAKKKKGEPEPPPPSAELGATLFRSLGCLACHRTGELGTDGLFGGGDLSQIASKRPPEFFTKWLTDPAQLNRDHRMPVFPLTPDQRTSLSLYLQTLAPQSVEVETAKPQSVDGLSLIRQAGCVSCHALPKSLAAEPTPKKTPLAQAALDRDQNTCLAEPAGSRPGFLLSENYRRAIRTYLAQARTPRSERQGQDLLAEQNCLACHARGWTPGIGGHLPQLAEHDPTLAEVLPGLQPPALHGIGDKLTDEALAASLAAPDPPRRPWLSVRMPRFRLTPAETAAIVTHFVESDRIPPRDDSTLLAHEASLSPAALEAAGPRLVTADGFGCTSCHAIGKWEPQKVALNAHGAALSNVGTRVRREWFDRWVRNPARIVPQMEMPSVQQPVRGVLGEQLDDQLAAVWRVLNRPDFTPPTPNALRVVRRSNLPDQPEPAALLTDVIEVGEEDFIKPLVIGLDNRHNVLFDLATARLAAWWTGDTARQQTRGKTWFWEAGMPQLLPVSDNEDAPSDLSLVFISSVYNATHAMQGDVPRQFITEFDALEHIPGGVKLTYRLQFGGYDKGQTHVVEQYESLPANADGRSGFRRTVSVDGSARGLAWRLLVLPADAIVAPGGRSATLAGPRGVVEVVLPEDAPAAERLAPFGKGVQLTRTVPASVVLEYRSEAQPDVFAPLPTPDRKLERQELKVVPGYQAERLPTTDEAMPTAMAFDREGTLFLTSLEGRVWRGRDTDGDQLVDELKPFADDLAAPYGLQIVESGKRNVIDVINKYAVLRLYDEDGDGRAERTETIASGWGHTRDYHDWAVGLPRDAHGNYYVALPCEQDGRSQAAAYLRGHALKLVPREPTADNPHRFAIEDFCAGLRFPQGLLMNSRGKLFASDNQGNYNPFNELNLLEPGQRYGFINSLEAKAGLNPPAVPAVVEIPHPWTRSVNGLGFAPPPFSGDLIGCEYDTRRLVRMSYEHNGQELQGAVYPFSREPIGGEPTFEGPLSLVTAPSGDVYVGNIRDSGWGAGSNTGSIVRLRRGEDIAGIAWVKHRPGGFRIRFQGTVDPQAAADPANYSVSSYRRISTPAYGGEDVDRRVEKIASLEVVGNDVILKLDELRDGFVYEFHLRNLTGGQEFFPAEAHYTLRHQVHEKQ